VACESSNLHREHKRMRVMSWKNSLLQRMQFLNPTYRIMRGGLKL